MICIVHDDGEDGAYGMVVGAPERIHSVWQCGRPECRLGGDGPGLFVIERCGCWLWWRWIRAFVGMGDPYDEDACGEKHSKDALAKLEDHWETIHPGTSWKKRDGYRR
jgi:hypothetical protein